jgi:hypothetical protein
MLVVLKPEVRPQWLGEEPADEAHLKALLAPYPSDGMVCWPVSPRVGDVKNNDAGLVEPIVLPSPCGAAGLRRPMIRCVCCPHRERSNQCRKPKSSKRCNCST